MHRLAGCPSSNDLLCKLVARTAFGSPAVDQRAGFRIWSTLAQLGGYRGLLRGDVAQVAFLTRASNVRFPLRSFPSPPLVRERMAGLDRGRSEQQRSLMLVMLNLV